MLIFSGLPDSGPAYTDVWSLSFTNPIKWTQLSPTGTVSVPYSDLASVYDPVRQRMLSFFGDEPWALGNLSGTPAWSMIQAAGQVPIDRYGACTIYDPPHQNLIMFGGFTYNNSTSLNDLWKYSLSSNTWTRLLTGGPPSARDLATAIYDPSGSRMIVFGGENNGSFLNDTWQLSLAATPAWTQLSPTGSPPSARYAHTAILDAPRNRVVIYGGANGAPALSDVFALSLAGGTSWSQLSSHRRPRSGALFPRVRLRQRAESHADLRRKRHHDLGPQLGRESRLDPAQYHGHNESLLHREFRGLRRSS